MAESALTLKDFLLARTEEAREAIEKSPAVFVDQVLNPPAWSLRIALRLLRRVLGFLRKWPLEPPPRAAS